MGHFLQDTLSEHKSGASVGIYSICSANKYVIEAALYQAATDGVPVLIEATSNQVDQFGGYTDLTPARFAAYVHEMADQTRFPRDRIVLGGDHLGPNVWQKEDASGAMAKARDQIQAYVSAGFTKIHLDASMRLGGDPGEPHEALDTELIADRAADLCQVAENAAQLVPGTHKIYYVVGTDVPTPGGAHEADDDSVAITTAEEVRDTIAANEKAFLRLGLEAAWEQVLAVVVQPGVEFSDQGISEYDPDKARALSGIIANYPRLVYEAHSTDYQTEPALRRMVADHFAILKVGPWLTFALREAIFALATIEQELLDGQPGITCSGVIELLEQVMMDQPEHWRHHYHGDADQLRLARRYSYSDRIRYYWPNSRIVEAQAKLLRNLNEHDIPATLLSQYLPAQYDAWRSGELSLAPADLIRHKILEVTGIYARACGGANHQ